MAEENPNGNGEGAQPQDPESQGKSQDPGAGEGAKPQFTGATARTRPWMIPWVA